ncbi:MAG: FecCD family ABC transporter permease [Brachybacterium tyrofermentans]|uniref:FecCD family ABC transporter permease n=1 Tax=Brachybacterium TaxID=43668 RepID=UPI00299F875C|nr:iron chelate uptake ABC transporter family permease subunit [Brachybacterium tyrofermentans]
MTDLDRRPAVLSAHRDRFLHLALGPVRLRLERRALRLSAVLLLTGAVVSLLALMLGDYRLSGQQVFAALAGRGDEITTVIVRDWRLPRALAALVFGAALAVSGAVFQSLTRNPLASPDIIGFSTGSYTGALLVLLVLGGGYLQVAAGAITGGIATALVIYVLAHRRGMQGFRLIIVGIAVSSMLGALNSYLLLVARREIALGAAIWGAGSLASVDTTMLRWGTLAIGLLLALVATVAPALRELELGDDVALAHGVVRRRVWAVAVVAGVALTAVVTAACGPIAFVSLVAPQIVRRLAGQGDAPLVPTALLGAVLLGAADLVGQHALPQPVPVGLVTVVVGGCYLLHLILRERRRRRP